MSFINGNEENISMDAPFRLYYQSPIGLVEMAGTDSALTGLNFVEVRPRQTTDEPAVLRDALRQIDEYFLGRRTGFTVPLKTGGTPFQEDVWRALRGIGYGMTASYQDIARTIGRPAAVRAVGAANGANPISIIIPCHRVIGKDGRLTGYGGGLWRKEWLLGHEQRGRGPLLA
jgi:methylated-DNA-[protein]-cysteine S-methyltransferase